MKRFLCLILTLLLVLACLPAFSFAADEVKIQVLLTGDLHGVLFHSNYNTATKAAGSGVRAGGLTRLATRIAEQRALNANTILIDAGDTVQGTPFTYYYSFYAQPPALQTSPVALALRTLNYDAWVLGNHEFNFGQGALTKNIDDAKAPASGGQTPVAVLAANYLDINTADGVTEWDPWIPDGAYITRTFDGVKVGILGLSTPNIPTWEPAANYAGILFMSFLTTAEYYIDYLKNTENCDIIIAACHSGMETKGAALQNTPPYPDSYGEFYSWEDQITALVANTEGIDLVLGAHSHATNTSGTIANAGGKSVPVLFAGAYASTLGIATITYDKDTNAVTNVARSTAGASSSVTPNAALVTALQPYEDAVWEDYLLAPVGEAAAAFPSPNMKGPNAFIDMLQKIQAETTGAEFSFCAPLLNSSAANVIDAGEIAASKMFDLYRYENWLFKVGMNGAEIKAWLEFAATKYAIDGSMRGGTTEATAHYASLGLVGFQDLTGPIYCDSLWGPGVSYTIDLSRPMGDRIVDLELRGVPVNLTEVYEVAVNSYRYTGGGGNVPYVKATLGADALDFAAAGVTLFDSKEELGESAGEIRNLLAEYIRSNSPISPTFEVGRGADYSVYVPDVMAVAVLATTDMHGRSTALNVNTGTALSNSMPRMAAVVNAQRVSYPNNILIDNGDTLQGTLVNTYWITKKPAALNPMVAAMIEMKYDVWNLGNHEFNYKPEQRDAQVTFAENGGISVLSANLVLKENGTAFGGANALADEPYYKPYAIKTFTDAKGNSVDVAVLGIGNANNASWDVPTNFPNLQFSSLGNPTGDVVFEIERWLPEIQAQADIVVLAIHSGLGNGTMSSLESQARRAIEQTRGIDMVIGGHDHSAAAAATTYKNLDNKNVCYVNPGAGANLSRVIFDVVFASDKTVSSFTVRSATNLATSAAEDDEVSTATLAAYNEARVWVTTPLGGRLEGDWTHFANDNGHILAQSQTMDLVHKGQIWATWLSFASDGVTGATVSIASPVFNHSIFSTTPRDMSLADILGLYRYDNNTLYMIEMTGAQLKAWLNFTADKYTLSGTAVGTDGTTIFGKDTVYGVDYILDISKPKGARLALCNYEGKPLEDAKVLRVAINSYRLSDVDFGKTTGITVADAVWAAEIDLTADRAPVPVLLGEYFAYMKTVKATDKPFKGTDSKWFAETKFAGFGDANLDGKLGASDAASILRHLVQLETLSPYAQYLGNVSATGTLSAADAARILRYLVELVTDFPAGAPAPK
ncbi:MAG: 5'-nucleotidase C-terminal domain-containing protein [Clostridiales bacterium]|nr:5'-nucleotidase C-terminal domain-containing protein [Clostridiales bacterium]